MIGPRKLTHFAGRTLRRAEPVAVGEPCRRERVIRIFPNDESALRLMGALLAESNETWAGRLYINMDEFKEWLIKRSESDAVSNVVSMAL